MYKESPLAVCITISAMESHEGAAYDGGGGVLVHGRSWLHQ